MRIQAPGLVYLMLILVGCLFSDMNAPSIQVQGSGILVFLVAVGWLGVITFYGSMLVATCRYSHWLAGLSRKGVSSSPNEQSPVARQTSLPRPLTGRGGSTDPVSRGKKRRLLAWISGAPLLLLIVLGARECGRQVVSAQHFGAGNPLPATPPPAIRDSTLINGRYTNVFFDFSVQIPSNWTAGIDPHATERQTLLDGLANQQNPEIKRAMKAAKTKIATLLTVFPKQELVGEASPTFAIVAEDVSASPRTTAEQYLEISKQSFSKIHGFTKKFGTPYYICCHGGTLVATDVAVQGGAVRGFMTFAVMIRRQCALTFVLSAGSPTNHDIVKGFLTERLKFQ